FPFRSEHPGKSRHSASKQAPLEVVPPQLCWPAVLLLYPTRAALSLRKELPSTGIESVPPSSHLVSPYHVAVVPDLVPELVVRLSDRREPRCECVEKSPGLAVNHGIRGCCLTARFQP